MIFCLQKIGQRPLEVTLLSPFFLYPCNANGEADFAQFPMQQKSREKPYDLSRQ
jgi:hypothetical protein